MFTLVQEKPWLGIQSSEPQKKGNSSLELSLHWGPGLGVQKGTHDQEDYCSLTTFSVKAKGEGLAARLS